MDHEDRLADPAAGSESNRLRASLKGAWGCLLGAGDQIGKILSLVAAPSAAVAIFLFWQEIVDLAGTPDFEVTMETLELRCAVELDTVAEVAAAQKDFGAVCGEAPLGVSLEAVLSNRDSIARTIESLGVELKLPARIRSEPLELTFVREVEHRVTNYRTQATLIPWRATPFLKGQTQTLELEFWPLSIGQRLPFARLRDALVSDSSLASQSVEFTLFALYPGEPEPLAIHRCRLEFEADSLKRFGMRSRGEQVAYVRFCVGNS